MAESPPARLYLVTPDHFDPQGFADDLARLFSALPVACLRLDLGVQTDEDEWRRAANHLLPVCHDADIALVIAEHYRLVRPLGLDGVHLRKGSTPIRSVRKELGADAIIGAEGGTSRHQGMSLAEAGADYVALGPVGASGSLGDGALADRDLFEWWSQMIEIPIVAEGGVHVDEVRTLSDTVDFVVPDRSLWSNSEIMIPSLREMADLLAG
ncbi:MAG: thiamine phosphate synthase [Pseudomonadota bacterium]